MAINMFQNIFIIQYSEVDWVVLKNITKNRMLYDFREVIYCIWVSIGGARCLRTVHLQCVQKGLPQTYATNSTHGFTQQIVFKKWPRNQLFRQYKFNFLF